MKAKNLKEFKALKKRYESITLEEIKKALKANCWFIGAQVLTGFGCDMTCTLCLPLKEDGYTNCNKCVYSVVKESGYQCLKGKNKKTYDRILYADTPTLLHNAFRARAKHMQTLLK